MAHIPTTVFVVSFLAAAVQGQGQRPYIGYVYPAGGQRGTTITVTVGGQYLNGPREALVSGGGVDLKILKHVVPLSRGQLNRIRQKLYEILQKRGVKPRARRRKPDPKDLVAAAKAANIKNFELDNYYSSQQKLRDPKRQPNPQIAETVTLEIRIAKDAQRGDRDLRLRGARGVTNPIVFEICDRREENEIEPNDKDPNTAMTVSLPATINGQIMPGDVDRFAFSARKGTRLVAAARARALVPYLADAVPGWFQATLAIYDEAGKRVAYSDDFRFDPDPVIFFRVPASGRYVLEIRDAIYRGREDFVYRIALGKIPFATDVFPLGGRCGARTKVQIRGWNLPVSTVTVDATGKSPGVVPITVGSGTMCSNPLPFALDTLPEVMEHEPNDNHSSADAIELPVIINGKIAHPGDRDEYQFMGTAGQTVVAEVHARRLGSPLDSMLELFDSQGQRIAWCDDYVDEGAGLETHHADAKLQATLPRNDTYVLRLSDTEGAGSDVHAYRLRVSEPMPDFELRVVPSCINAGPGATVPITVHGLRRDGFDGDIELYLDGAQGFVLHGGWIPAGQDKVRATLTIPTAMAREPVAIRIAGLATIGGREVQHPAVPAEDRMQAFIYRHLVPAKELLVDVSGRARFRPVRVMANLPVELEPGKSTRVRLTGVRPQDLARLAFDLDDAPKGIKIEKVEPAGKFAVALVLAADAKQVEKGRRGNLIVDVFVKRRGQPARRRAQRRIAVGVLPAIPFVVGQVALKR